MVVPFSTINVPKPIIKTLLKEVINMAFWFTHALIAFTALQKLERKSEFSSFEQIDDYLFGAVAPDIRYVKNADRGITHLPSGKKSAFEAFRGKNFSDAFIAGYESHLVCDRIWAGEHKWLLEKSVYEHFKISPTDVAQKFSLYFFVDDYFQGKSNWLYPMLFAGNVFRANEASALKLLGFSDSEITAFKAAASLYLKEPGVNFFQALTLLRIPLEEKALSVTLNRFSGAGNYLSRFFNASVKKSVEAVQGKM